MKIVHLCLSGPFNDDWGYQDNMIPKYNVKDGHEVTVITSTQVDSTKMVGYEYVQASIYMAKDCFKVIRVPFTKYLPQKIREKLRVYKTIYQLLLDEKPDFIFVHGFSFMNIIEVRKYMINTKGVQLVFDSHASYDNSASNIFSKVILHKFIWKMISKSVMPYVEKVFVLAPGCKKFANEMYDISDEKMEYLFLGADTEKIDFDNKENIRTRIRKELNIADDDFVFISGGKLSKGKNVKELLLSFKEIDSSNIKLVIFGAFTNDHKEEMLDLISQCDRVRYIGWLSGSEVYDYYLASDAAVFPGTKSALWEQAICSGLPIVCRRWPGMEYVDVGGNVIFVENNIIELARKIELLASDRELYNEMKQVACTKGFETFSYEVIARQAISLNK